MYGIEKFLENVNFSEFTDVKDLFRNGYIPFAIKNIPEIQKGFEAFEDDKNSFFRITKDFFDFSEGLYIHLCRYILNNFEKPPIKMSVKPIVYNSLMSTFDENLPDFQSITQTLEQCSIENANSKAEKVHNIFKNKSWVLDNFIDAEDRSLLYELWDKDIVKMHWERTFVDHISTGNKKSQKEWRIHYWLYLPKQNIIEKEEKGTNPYDELPPEYWNHAIV